jgi:hypothetical protein
MRQHTEYSAPARRAFLKLAVVGTTAAGVGPFLGSSRALARSDTVAKSPSETWTKWWQTGQRSHIKLPSR